MSSSHAQVRCRNARDRAAPGTAVGEAGNDQGVGIEGIVGVGENAAARGRRAMIDATKAGGRGIVRGASASMFGFLMEL